MHQNFVTIEYYINVYEAISDYLVSKLNSNYCIPYMTYDIFIYIRDMI